MKAYKINKATKVLGGNRILKGLDLEIERGEVMSLVGPSGSGKSTLLRTMNRLIELDSGSIVCLGKSIKDMDPVSLRRKAVLVPQESVMLPGTVQNFLNYCGKTALHTAILTSRCFRIPSVWILKSQTTVLPMSGYTAAITKTGLRKMRAATSAMITCTRKQNWMSVWTG